MKNISLVLIILFSIQIKAQKKFIDLRKNCKVDTSIINPMYNSFQGIDYTKIIKMKPINLAITDDYLIENYMQQLTFIDDYNSMNECILYLNSKKNSDEISNIKNFDNIDNLLNKIKNEKVVLINEAHSRIHPRAFILSILPKLKKLGFTHISFETLSYNKNKNIDYTTGYYTKEPVYGELVRSAHKLGFIRFAYEDSIANKHTENQRDSMQAVNIFNKIKSAKPTDKFFIVVGYGHNSEDIQQEASFISVAMWLQILFKINPCTIDQLQFLENYSNASFSRDSIHNKVPFYISKSEYKKSNNYSYNDFYIIHPKTTLENNRPNWNKCYGLRNETKYKLKNKNKTVLIQAYYKSEYDLKNINQKIPADQTFYTNEKGIATFYLKPSYKYVIVERDENNQIISSQNLNFKVKKCNPLD